MLILSRKINEQVYVGDDIVVTVVELSPGRVRLGFSAPDHVKILREELRDQPPVGDSDRPVARHSASQPPRQHRQERRDDPDPRWNRWRDL